MMADWMAGRQDRWMTAMLIVENSMMDSFIHSFIDTFIHFFLLLPLIIAVYQKVSYQTFRAKNIFYQEKAVHNLGKARYQLNLVKWKHFTITNEFAASVCNLPQSYNRMAYHRFIKNWGTVGF